MSVLSCLQKVPSSTSGRLLASLGVPTVLQKHRSAKPATVASYRRPAFHCATCGCSATAFTTAFNLGHAAKMVGDISEQYVPSRSPPTST